MLGTVVAYLVLILLAWIAVAILAVLLFRNVWHRAVPRRVPATAERAALAGAHPRAEVDPPAQVAARTADEEDERRSGPPTLRAL